MEKEIMKNIIVYLLLCCVLLCKCYSNVLTYLGKGDNSMTSYTKYSSWNSESTGIISFSFITGNPNGLLLHVGDSNSTEWTRNYLELRIKNGMLNFISRIKNGTNVVKWKRVWYPKEVDDLKWHNIQIRRNGINAMVDLDGERSLVRFGDIDMVPVKLKGALYIGGLPHRSDSFCRSYNYSHQFVGAIKNVGYGPLFEFQSGYERILAKEGTVWGYNDHCLMHRGRKSLCHNGGICVNKFNNYSCNCLGTGFEGRHCQEASTPVQLKGLDFVEWKPFVWQRSLESNNIAMMFKTVEPSGVLLYIGNETKYLIIELFRGRLMVGTHMDKYKLNLIVSNQSLNNNYWHLVEVSRRELQLKVSVNRTNATHAKVPGSNMYRNLKDSEIFIGGKSYLHWLPGSLSKQYFMGCLRQIYYNGGNVIKTIINSYRTTNRRRIKHGNIVKGCPTRTTKPPFTRGPRSKRHRPTFHRHTRARQINEKTESESSGRSSEFKKISGTSQTMLIIGIIIGVVVLIIVVSATVHYLKHRYRQELALSAVFTRTPPTENGTSCATMHMYISPSTSGEKSDKLKDIPE